MKISEVAEFLESVAPLSLQEDYDNAGLITGDRHRDCTGILCTLDVTEAVIAEAVSKQCNLIVSHHPVIFRGIKSITGTNHVQRELISAIRNDIALYSAHTNLDNVIGGVNARIADKLGLRNRSVLSPKTGMLKKLYTFVPNDHLEKVRDAVFAAGAGHISNYSECSFTHPGTGTYLPGEGTTPFSGIVGQRQNEPEIKLEVILPAYAEKEVMRALFQSHPYEEVAYDLVSLTNIHQQTGSGMIGDIEEASEGDFLEMLKVFNPRLVRHSPLTGRPVRKVALCGGAGSFLTANAIKAGADAFVTADLKYHEFFAAEGRLVLYDIGHFESEQFTTDLFVEILERNFPNFAVLKSEVKTNPVNYFTGK